MSIEDLRNRASAEHFEKLQRADFYRLIGVLKGTTSPMVDFSTYTAKAGDWVMVRPGQVFRYDFSRPWSGWLLVFRPDSLTIERGSRTVDELNLLNHVEELTCLRSLNGEQHDWMIRSLKQLQHDSTARADAPIINQLMRLQLANTLLRLSMWQSSDAVASAHNTAEQVNFRRFRKLLDADFTSRHQVQHYANALGMSEKTLSRVCVTATGVPAKTVIKQRLVLEAKRLLAHTTMAAQSIGCELGFDEASNFVKFFRRETGMTPLAFRQEIWKPNH